MDTKNVNKNTEELNIITSYAQLALYTLKHSNTEITPKSIKAEIKMLYEKFGSKEVIRLAKTIIKDK